MLFSPLFTTTFMFLRLAKNVFLFNILPGTIDADLKANSDSFTAILFLLINPVSL